MTFLAPAALVAALAAIVALVALHLISRHRPPPVLLPTARFIPAGSARAVARASRPRDLPLLALRVLLVMLIGLAFARPIPLPERRPLARVVLVDLSRSVADTAEVRDSVRALLRPGDVLVAFDSTPRIVAAPWRSGTASAQATDARAIEQLVPTEARGALSAALVTAARAGWRLRERADSVELALVSPLSREIVDRATGPLIRLSAGPLRLVRVAAAADGAAEPRSLEIRAPADDPLRVAVERVTSASAAVRVSRRPPGTADSAWARDGGVLVFWPDSDSALWPARHAVDTVGAVIAANAVVVAPFARRRRTPAGVPVAHWVDGEIAAVETPLGAGCVRSVNVPVHHSGDLPLRASFGRFVAALALPCGGERHLEPLSDSGVGAPLTVLSKDRGAGMGRVPQKRGAAGSAVPQTGEGARSAAPQGDEGGGGSLPHHGAAATHASSRTLVLWLLSAALVLALLEPLVRRQRTAVSR